MGATFEDLSELELETIAKALKGTPWLALFSRVSKPCQAASSSISNVEELRRMAVLNMASSVELVKWAKAEGCPSRGRRASRDAASNLEVMKWAAAGSCETDSYLGFHAAVEGNLEVLQYMKENGSQWPGELLCHAAALGGHVDVIEWARNNGCLWDSSTCYLAARRGHLEVLKWLKANGCPWSSESVRAACSGHANIAQWLNEE